MAESRGLLFDYLKVGFYLWFDRFLLLHIPKLGLFGFPAVFPAGKGKRFELGKKRGKLGE